MTFQIYPGNLLFFKKRLHSDIVGWIVPSVFGFSVAGDSHYVLQGKVTLKSTWRRVFPLFVTCHNGKCQVYTVSATLNSAYYFSVLLDLSILS